MNQGAFNYVNIIVKPLEAGLYLLEIKQKVSELGDFSPIIFPIVVSENSVAPIIRETAIFAELTCRAYKKSNIVPNRQERLKQILKTSRFASSVQHDPFINLNKKPL